METFFEVAERLESEYGLSEIGYDTESLHSVVPERNRPKTQDQSLNPSDSLASEDFAEGERSNRLTQSILSDRASLD